ncbi:HAD hydrolase family protein [Candidatus Bathyarchaeota archaeon]|nr:HAD hydrolase family protein [Candidatus Bathyarchaeota archaeon]
MSTEASQRDKRIFITDCEGPISKNDNAFELTSNFVQEGDNFFTLISKFDDVLADVIKKPNYKAGDTLRLILPFLKAYGVTDKKIRNFSAKNLLLVPGAKETLTFVRQLMSSFIVSTSYEHYIFALCTLTDFPFENTYCTRLNIDKYQISTDETKRLKELGKWITSLPMIEIPKNANSITKFSKRDQEIIKELNEIFWNEIPKMEIGKILTEIDPIGGTKKARSVENIVNKTNCCFEQVMYVGDSITDAPALKLVKENGGLAVSFNGNKYSVQESNVAVLSTNTLVTSVIAELFSRLGKEGTLKFVNEWSISRFTEYCTVLELVDKKNMLFSGSFPQVEEVTVENVERLIKQSSVFRKTVRGETIGNLG